MLLPIQHAMVIGLAGVGSIYTVLLLFSYPRISPTKGMIRSTRFRILIRLS